MTFILSLGMCWFGDPPCAPQRPLLAWRDPGLRSWLLGMFPYFSGWHILWNSGLLFFGSLGQMRENYLVRAEPLPPLLWTEELVLLHPWHFQAKHISGAKKQVSNRNLHSIAGETMVFQAFLLSHRVKKLHHEICRGEMKAKATQGTLLLRCFAVIFL